MLAVHQGTQTEYEVIEVIAGKVFIRNLSTRCMRRMSFADFEASFYIYRSHGEEESPFEVVPTKEQELAGIEAMANEIVWEDKWIRAYQDQPAIKIKRKRKKVKEEPSHEETTTTQEKSSKGKKAKKGKTKESTTTDAVSLKDICGELGLDPSKARRILRKTDLVQSGRWTWNDKEQISQVKKILKTS